MNNYDLKPGLTYHESHKKTCVKLLGPFPRENRLLASGFGSLDLVEVSLMMITVVAATQENAARVKKSDQRRRTNNLQISSRHTWNWHVFLD